MDDLRVLINPKINKAVKTAATPLNTFPRVSPHEKSQTATTDSRKAIAKIPIHVRINLGMVLILSNGLFVVTSASYAPK